MLQIKHEKAEMDQSYKEWLCVNDTTIKEKGIGLNFCSK
jgi:hypothetical protein